MPDKYIVTIRKPSEGLEIICRPRTGFIVDQEEAKAFVLQHTKDFPGQQYHIYKLEEIAKEEPVGRTS